MLRTPLASRLPGQYTKFYGVEREIEGACAEVAAALR